MMFSYIYKKNQPPFFTVTPHTPNSPVSWAGCTSGVCLLTDLLGILLFQKEMFLSEPGRSWKDPVLEDPAICIRIITFLSWKGWASFTSWSWITKPREQALQIRFLLVISSKTSSTKVMGYPRVITVAGKFQNQLSFMLGYVTSLSLPESTWIPKLALHFLSSCLILTSIILNENARTSELPYFLFISCPLSHSLKRISYTWKLKCNATASLIKQICISQVGPDSISV